MSVHLTQMQVSEALVAGLPGQARTHLLGCKSCQLEVSRFQSELALFGSAVRVWSETVAQQVPNAPALPQSRRLFSVPQFAVVAIALAIIFVVALIGTSLSHRSSFPSSYPPPAAVTDAALLTQVDVELSHTVPESMEPLTKLVGVDQSKVDQSEVEKVRQ